MTATVPGMSSSVAVAKIPAAIVLRRHVNTGRVYVRTWSPDSKLEELANVFAPFKAEGSTLVWNGVQWVASAFVQITLGDLRDVVDYNPATLQDKTSIRWDATNQEWAMIPATGGLPDIITYFLNRYDAEANTARQAADATLIIERYVTVQADGHGEKTAAQSSTPSEGNKLVRKIWHKATAFEDSDVTTWTLAHTFADDTAYIDTIDTFQELLTAATYGSIPLTLAQTWESVPAYEGPLDIAPGAAAAYSLRLLDSDYTGDAIRVRRASDSAEQDIGFDGNGDLDTSALATFCAGTDGFVKTWYDQSGNGNHATQTTTANQPKIYDSSTGIELENALAALRFDGSNDYLQLAFGQGALSAFCYTGVFSPTNATSLQMLVDLRDANDDGTRILLTNGGQMQTSADTVDAVINYTATQQILTGEYDGTNLTSYINGIAGTSLTGTSTNATNNGRIGSDATIVQFHLNGNLQELILYFSDQSANRAAIEANIATFYGITI